MDDRQAVRELAALSAFEFDRYKKDEAKRLGVSVTALSTAVTAEQRKAYASSDEASDIFQAAHLPPS